MSNLRATSDQRSGSSSGDGSRTTGAPKKPKRGGGPLLPWKPIGKWAAVAAIWAGIAGVVMLGYFTYDMPDTSEVVQYQRRPAVTLLAADGQQFARFGDLQGNLLDPKALPPLLVKAVLATEDRRFYTHFGVDPLGLARALWVNWRTGRRAQGGSTVTQQLAKNLFLTPDKTIKRKVQEALLALWLERRYDKDEILAAYLNRTYFGAGTYGVDAAARTYFGKPVTELSLREAAIIAGLLKAPSRFSPQANPDKAQARAAIVLASMVDAGSITEAEAKQALDLPPTPRRKPGAEGDGRYFGAWVVDQVDDYIGPNHGDVIVETTFDAGLQRAAESRVTQLLRGPGATANVSQAAVVLMGHDGAVRAVVGGRDYDDSQFNRATQALRQPGSSFKPFVYLAALEAGMSPDEHVFDAPYRKGKWAPENYDRKYHGDVTLEYALSHSLNTATIRLLEQVGVDQTRSAARRLGIASPMGRDLSLALGTSEVTLLELIGAYASISEGGRAVMPFAITEIRSTDGKLLYRRQGQGAGYPAAASDIANLTLMMMGVLSHGTGMAAQLDRMAAGKTGTTQDYKDAWFVGFTADYVAGVWMGNDSGQPMKRITGGTLPAKLWRDIMLDAHRGLPPRPLPSLDDTLARDAVALSAPAGDDAGPHGEAASEIPAVESEPLGELADAPESPANGGESRQNDRMGDLIRRLTSGRETAPPLQ